METVRQFSAAQDRIVGKFCSNCRIHRNAEGGRLLPVANKRTRWVCRWCAKRYDEGKRVSKP